MSPALDIMSLSNSVSLALAYSHSLDSQHKLFQSISTCQKLHIYLTWKNCSILCPWIRRCEVLCPCSFLDLAWNGSALSSCTTSTLADKINGHQSNTEGIFQSIAPRTTTSVAHSSMGIVREVTGMHESSLWGEDYCVLAISICFITCRCVWVGIILLH